jgi:hypothetical protein
VQDKRILILSKMPEKAVLKACYPIIVAAPKNEHWYFQWIV